MKFSKHIIGFTMAAGLFFTSCKKHEYYQTNPNNPSTGTPSLLLTNILISTFNVGPTSPAYAGRHLTYYERPNTDVNYGWGASGFGSYDLLRQIKDMDEKAQQTGEQNYQGLAKFLRAVYFLRLTETFGDVPYSEAMKALEGVPTPKYDLQKDVYKGILTELDEANILLDPTKGNLAGDIIYSGSSQILQWKKLVTAFTLRVLVHLSKKETDAELAIKTKFQNIISNPGKYPLLTGNADNGQLKYNLSAADNAYPTFQSLSFQTSVSIEKGFADLLKTRNDPRLFNIAEPISGQPANVFTSYNGVNAGLSVSAQQSASANASRIKSRYWNNAVNEPMIFLGYAEQEFLIAEAIARNWITGAGTAQQHYVNGITASMAFYGISGSAVTTYLAEPNVVYIGANAIDLIITQKYISFFMNSGWEAFYEQRRTGIPVFNVGPGTLNGGQIPKRWRYPQNEFSLNADNVNAAVQRQFSGNDNVNGVMWVLQ
jgi:hypothetical protein